MPAFFDLDEDEAESRPLPKTTVPLVEGRDTGMGWTFGGPLVALWYRLRSVWKK